jgi:hypothetical protein
MLSLDVGLTHYLAEIRKFPMLLPDQEAAYATRWREHGDRVLTPRERCIFEARFLSEPSVRLHDMAFHASGCDRLKFARLRKFVLRFARAWRTKLRIKGAILPSAYRSSICLPCGGKEECRRLSLAAISSGLYLYRTRASRTCDLARELNGRQG